MEQSYYGLSARRGTHDDAVLFQSGHSQSGKHFTVYGVLNPSSTRRKGPRDDNLGSVASIDSHIRGLMKLP